jgi:Ion channel
VSRIFRIVRRLGRSLYIGAVDSITNPAQWGIVLTTMAIVSVIIALHYEALRNCIRLLPAFTARRRRRVIFLILIILLTHVAEIWIFGGAYLVLMQWDVFGSIGGELETLALLDYVYYSAMVYTTVGFGDLIPDGAIRFMTGMEALTGLVMITWSASFTFLEMQRDWQVSRD